MRSDVDCLGTTLSYTCRAQTKNLFLIWRIMIPTHEPQAIVYRHNVSLDTRVNVSAFVYTRFHGTEGYNSTTSTFYFTAESEESILLSNGTTIECSTADIGNAYIELTSDTVLLNASTLNSDMVTLNLKSKYITFCLNFYH